MLPQTLDRNRYDYGEVPVPPVISAQLSLLREALIIRPWTQEVRSQLEALVAKKKPESWLTVYLVMFILLHNCSLLNSQIFLRNIGASQRKRSVTRKRNVSSFGYCQIVDLPLNSIVNHSGLLHLECGLKIQPVALATGQGGG